jgi:hypothetical protein
MLKNLASTMRDSRLVRLFGFMAFLVGLDYFWHGTSTSAQMTFNAVLALSLAWATDK